MRLATTTLLALVAFAANSILCRLALSGGGIDAISFSVIRFAGAATVLLLIGGWPRRGASRGREWTSAFILATYAAPFAIAYSQLSAATGSLLLFGTVQVTMMTAALRGGERLHVVQWLGLASALGGLIYLVAPGLTGPPLPAAMLMIVAGVAWGIYTLRGRGSADPLAETTRNFVQALPLVLMPGLFVLPQLHADRSSVWLATASGVVASGLGYVAWYSALRDLAASRAAIAQLAVPILAAMGGVIFLSERLSSRLMVSSALVLGGIALAISRRTDRR